MYIWKSLLFGVSINCICNDLIRYIWAFLDNLILIQKKICCLCVTNNQKRLRPLDACRNCMKFKMHESWIFLYLFKNILTIVVHGPTCCRDSSSYYIWLLWLKQYDFFRQRLFPDLKVYWENFLFIWHKNSWPNIYSCQHAYKNL